jgi:hypothetical protein
VQGPLLEQFNALMGDYCVFQVRGNKPRSIMMTYPKVFDSAYIKPEVELEIGPMSGMTPNSECRISPYCSDVVKDVLGSADFQVKAIEAKKTFWDKVSILHVEAHRPEDKHHPARYSRHYYDIYQMLHSTVLEEAMDDLVLLKTVVEFKHQFYPQSWANYEGAKAGVFTLIPEPFRIEVLQKDYAEMQEMIFGDSPNFDDILELVAEFETRLNNIK